MKTLDEMEAAICHGMTRFEHQYIGREPQKIRAHFLGDLLLIRLLGVLTDTEQQLAMTMRRERGRQLLKEVRTQLIETARPVLETLVEEITGVKTVSLHHDISTSTGEEVLIFTLVRAPLETEPNKAKPKICEGGHLPTREVSRSH